MSTASEVTRMSGLISGLDVESLVKAGTANTKNSIDTKKQKLQTTVWKQEAYRDIISAITDFQDKYLSITSADSIRANAVMKSNKAESSDSRLAVSATSTATAGKYEITSVSAAKAASIGGTKASAGNVELDFSKAASGSNTVAVTLDGTTKNITFKGGANADEAKENFLTALNDKFSTVSNAKFSFQDGTNKLTIKNDAGDKVSHLFTVGYSNAVGLANDASNTISNSSTLGSIDFNQELQGGEYKFSINGKSFTFNDKTTVKDMMSTINNADIGVKMKFNSLSQSFTLESDKTGAGNEIKIKQEKGNLVNALFNMGSDEVGVTSVSASLTAKTPVDTSFTITADQGGLSSEDTIKLNGVTLGITGLTQSQAREDIKIDNTDYKAALYTDADGETIYKYSDGTATHYAKKDGEKFTDIAVTEGKTANIDGVDQEDLQGMTPDNFVMKKLGLEKQLKPHTEEEYTKALNDAYKNAVPEGTGSFAVTMNDGKAQITFTPGEGENVTIQAGGKLELNGEVGGSASNFTESPLSADAVLSEGNSLTLKLGDGSTVDVQSESGNGITINDMLATGLFDYNDSTGTLSVKGNQTVNISGGDAASDVKNALGVSTLVGSTAGGELTARGSNAQMTVNGVTLESASNTFNVEGVSFSVGNMKEFSEDDIAAGTAEAVTVNVSKDTSKVKDVIVGFMQGYNDLLDKINGMLSTSRPKSNGAYFDPLTEDQEEEMDQDEIDKWNEKAKQGLLYHDSTLSRVFTNLRSAINASVGGMTIQALGIDTSSNYTDYGKLQLTTDGEAKLDEAIEKYGDKIAEFFTDTKSGLGTALNNVVKAATDTSVNSAGYAKGLLTSLAGVANTRSDKKNTMKAQIDSLTELINNLKTRYENQQSSLWKKYSKLETYMNNMNMQSSSIFGTSLFGGQQQ